MHRLRLLNECARPSISAGCPVYIERAVTPVRSSIERHLCIFSARCGLAQRCVQQCSSAFWVTQRKCRTKGAAARGHIEMSASHIENIALKCIQTYIHQQQSMISCCAGSLIDGCRSMSITQIDISLFIFCLCRSAGVRRARRRRGPGWRRPRTP